MTELGHECEHPAMRASVLLLIALALGCADAPPAEVPRPLLEASAAVSVPSAEASSGSSVAPAAPPPLPKVDCSGWPSDRDPVIDARSVQVRGAFVGMRLTAPTSVRALPGELDVVVLEGAVSVARGDSRVNLSAWKAARVRGAGARLEPNGSACVVVGLSTEFASLEKALNSKVAVDTSSPIQETDFARVPELVWSGGRASARLGFEGSSASLSVLSMSQDLEVAEHTHATSDEILIGLTGAKWLYRASAPGSTALDLEQGALLEPRASAQVAAGVLHAAHRFAGSAGAERFFALQLYTPGGPEQRFKALAAENAAPAKK